LAQINKLQKILLENRKRFLEYNAFKKRLFCELAPKENELILFLFPWLLSINEPQCPGYIPKLKDFFTVFNIEYEKEIKKREGKFKKKFGIIEKGTLLKPHTNQKIIQGLYTIGSLGSIAQTSMSDCDIWICLNKKEFDLKNWQQLNQKVNLIKDWMDINVKLPVYFFISDTTDIKKCQFGVLDSESSGSTQQKVLKEEFYRTLMIIKGKIPLWWLCHDSKMPINYQEALQAVESENFWEYDIVDLGDLETIGKAEYFGAALWQFHKSLTYPLKSIIKLLLLRILLEADNEMLFCHQIRNEVMNNKVKKPFLDHSIFTMNSILDYYLKKDYSIASFLIECYYMRCDINLYNRTQKLKNEIIKDFLKQHPIDRNRQSILRKSDSWDFHLQIDLGDKIFKLLLQIYREISQDNAGVLI